MKTTLSNELQTFKDELQIALDDIEAYKIKGDSINDKIIQRDQIEANKMLKELEVKSVDTTLEDVDNAIKALNNTLKFENNFTGDIYDEITKFIQEDEWSDNNQISDDEYYYKANEYMKTVAFPPVNITLNIVNFFEIIEEQRNWDRLSIGDIITIYHEKLGIDVQAKVTEINHNYSDGTISIVVSNGKKRESIKQQFSRAFYTINKMNDDYSKLRPKLLAASSNFNTRNDRISIIPTIPSSPAISHKSNDDGSVNLTVTWNFPDSNKDADNIDGFKIYLYSSTTNERHLFGSALEEITPNEVNASLRSFTYTSLVANRYYTIGIQSYRRVDEDINSNGILLSDIATSGYPYQPEQSLQINGDVNGKVNGSLFLIGNAEPDIETLAGQNVVLIDSLEKTIKVKTFEEFEFKKVNVGEAETVSGYKPETEGLPNSIPVRNEEGIIPGSITGDATSVGGKLPENILTNEDIGILGGIAPLDDSGNVPLEHLGNIIETFTYSNGEYIGDGLVSRIIELPFIPRLVKVYTTDSNDYSVYIPSAEGGLVLKNGVNGVYMEGIDSTVSPSFGKLTENGFQTGNSEELFINKLNVKYHWEAVK